MAKLKLLQTVFVKFETSEKEPFLIAARTAEELTELDPGEIGEYRLVKARKMRLKAIEE